jgi:hypothetical protein
LDNADAALISPSAQPVQRALDVPRWMDDHSEALDPAGDPTL